MNVIHLIGNVGREPELRKTQGGKDVASFSIATSERWRDGEGEKHEKTTWHNCIVWGALSKVVGNWVEKGSKIMVSGRLEKRKYKTKDGDEREAIEVIVDKLELLSRANGTAKKKVRDDDDDDDDREDEDEMPRSRKSERRGDPSIPDDLDDEIPF